MEQLKLCVSKTQLGVLTFVAYHCPICLLRLRPQCVGSARALCPTYMKSLKQLYQSSCRQGFLCIAALFLHTFIVHCMYSYRVPLTFSLAGKPPPLKNLPALAEKYSPRGDDDLMVLSSTRDFYLQPVSAAHGYGKQIPR